MRHVHAHCEGSEREAWMDPSEGAVGTQYKMAGDTAWKEALCLFACVHHLIFSL